MLLGPPQPSPQPPPEFAGHGDAGTRGPGAGATPRRAQLWPRPRRLRAPGAPRIAGAARMDRRGRPGPLRRRPRGPLPGRGAAGGAREAWAPSPQSSPARAAGAAKGARRAGPRPALHAARAVLGGRCPGAAPGAPAPSWASRGLRAQLSRPLSSPGGGRGGRVQCAGRSSLIVRQRGRSGCPFLPHLV
ncbi:PREDICTED: translation initiation factor IF-2-like [Chinchilla lanigera]|uniref:translation initiation factor IF-2-like n=1 Tax=Chinchilla lanigera TaxID=34839 RepID=UPI000697B1D7|nr:PREDICTED: translation initiation factor IF-2-like [Chinchilla lanigera]